MVVVPTVITAYLKSKAARGILFIIFLSGKLILTQHNL